MNNLDSSSNSDFISSFTSDISENLNINNKIIGELKLIYKSRPDGVNFTVAPFTESCIL